MPPWGTARTCPLASDARGLLGVDVALGAANGDQVADPDLQPGFLVGGRGPGVADNRHALFLPEHLDDMAGIMLPSVQRYIWQLSCALPAPAAWGWSCGMALSSGERLDRITVSIASLTKRF